MQYTDTSPHDDWIVVEHGLVAPAKSSDVDSCHDNSWDSEEGDGSSLEMEVCHVILIDNYTLYHQVLYNYISYIYWVFNAKFFRLQIARFCVNHNRQE